MTSTTTIRRSPYLDAWRWIEAHAGTDSARDLAKLLLSLAQGADFSVRECVDKLDGPRAELALLVISRYVRGGGTEEEKEQLVALGHRVGKAFPQLQELAQAAREAKHAVRELQLLEPLEAGDRDLMDATQGLLQLATGGHLDLDEVGRARAAALARKVRELVHRSPG